MRVGDVDLVIRETRDASEWIVRARERDAGNAVSIDGDRRGYGKIIFATWNWDARFDRNRISGQAPPVAATDQIMGRDALPPRTETSGEPYGPPNGTG